MRLHLSDLYYLTPELTLIITAAVLAVLDITLPKKISRTLLGWLSLLGLAISAGFVAHFMKLLQLEDGSTTVELPIQLLNYSYRIDAFSSLFKCFILAGTALVIFMSIGSLKQERISQQGEYYYLFLPAAVGAMVMASSGDLITLFVGLECLSMTSYILVALRKNEAKSSEAAFKYVVMGSIGSAFILYGMSFLYGLTGTTVIHEIHQELSKLGLSYSAMIYLSFFLMMAGFGLKIAAAPFHAWAPGVYQGSPTPVAGFLATVSKAAGFAVLLRVMFNVYYGLGSAVSVPYHTDIFLAIMVLAALAMILGNTMALLEKDMKRMLAYSGIANAGYLLVPAGIQMGGRHTSNFSELMFYLIVYLFMTLGAYSVLMIVSGSSGQTGVKAFAGLYYRAPWLAVAMLMILLSLAGIPISGGFFGKLYIILGTILTKQYWLAVVMIFTSVISFYYFFGVIRQMFMRTNSNLGQVKGSYPVAITVWICVAVTVLLGIFPHIVINFIENIFHIRTDFFMF